MSEENINKEVVNSDKERIKQELINKPEIIDSLLHEDSIKKLFVAQYKESHSGPLPSPKTLQHYENILVGAAERIFLLAENQANHRQNFEIHALNAEIEHNREFLKQTKLRIFFGFFCAILLIALTAYALFKDNTAVAISLIGIIIGLATVFVIGKRSQQDTETKKRMM